MTKDSTSDVSAVRLTCAQAADLIGVPVKTLERWRLAGKGPPYFHPVGMRPFYSRSDVLDWLNGSRVETIWRRPPKAPASPGQ